MAKENRGGDRKAFQFASRKEAIQNLIKKFKQHSRSIHISILDYVDTSHVKLSRQN